MRGTRRIVSHYLVVLVKTTHDPERRFSYKFIVMLHLSCSNSFNFWLFVYVSESVRGCVCHVQKLWQVRIEPNADCTMTKTVNDYTKITDSMRPNFVITSFGSSSPMSMLLSTFVLNFISCFSASLSRFVHFLICAFSVFIRWNCPVLVSMCLVSLTTTERKKLKHALFLYPKQIGKNENNIFLRILVEPSLPG
jgi:hypothetical protein